MATFSSWPDWYVAVTREKAEAALPQGNAEMLTWWKWYAEQRGDTVERNPKELTHADDPGH